MAVSQLLFPTHLKTCVDKWEERHHILLLLLLLPFVETSRDQFEEKLRICEAKRREYRPAVRRRDELNVQRYSVLCFAEARLNLHVQRSDTVASSLLQVLFRRMKTLSHWLQEGR